MSVLSPRVGVSVGNQSGSSIWYIAFLFDNSVRGGLELSLLSLVHEIHGSGYKAFTSLSGEGITPDGSPPGLHGFLYHGYQ